MAKVILDNVSVNFLLKTGERDRLFPSLRRLKNSAWQEPRKTKSALDNLSLEINDQERVGLVGRNGAGKSTLLRVICGVLKPSHGEVKTIGSVGAMFKGLDIISPSLSPRENIRHYSELKNLSKKSQKHLEEDLEDFAEIGEYFDQPLVSFSAGMRARFNFGLLTSMSHDIVVIDEGIGAGDQFFREKSKERLDKMYAAASILIMASHSDHVLENFCTRGLLIQDGKVCLDDNISDVIAHYKGLL